MTAPQGFFNLDSFAHARIFDSLEHVWQVLPLIKDYIRHQKLGAIAGQISPQAYLINPEQIIIGEGTVVESGAYIQGPCIIGRNCQIRHGAYIRGDLITGDGCVIGHTTEVKNALFLDQAHAAHFAYVGDSVLGNRVNLGAGVKCANFRLDHAPVNVRFHGKKYITGLRKMGAIIGDEAQLGCNSVVNPGQLIEPKTHVPPCTVIGAIARRTAAAV